MGDLLISKNRPPPSGMVVIDAVPPEGRAARSAVESLQRHERQVIIALRDLVDAASALPTASPLRELLERQARAFVNAASWMESERHIAFAREASRHI